MQNKHREVVKLLVDGVKDLDVLARNNFGRGCVTEAFQCEDTEICTLYITLDFCGGGGVEAHPWNVFVRAVAMLLEHSSASEERLAEGTGMGKDAIKEEVEEDGDESDSNSPKVLQETVLEFNFAPGLPTLRARELALEWSKDAFGSTAEEDITGVSIWSAALILSRWVIDHRDIFNGKQVCELGSGCGVSGLAVHKYTNAARVVLSDLFAHTIQNLEHNIELNKKSADKKAGADDEDKQEAPVLDCCGRCGAVQRFTPDNPEGKLMTCGGCRSVAYCSRECQKKAWKKHKPDCKAIRSSASRRRLSRRARRARRASFRSRLSTGLSARPGRSAATATSSTCSSAPTSCITRRSCRCLSTWWTVCWPPKVGSCTLLPRLGTRLWSSRRRWRLAASPAKLRRSRGLQDEPARGQRRRG